MRVPAGGGELLGITTFKQEGFSVQPLPAGHHRTGDEVAKKEGLARGQKGWVEELV